MQLSAVSRNFKEAVQSLVPLNQGLDFTLADAEPPTRFDSALLLSWAPKISRMAMDSSSLSQHGLQEFVSAASSLVAVKVTCDDPCAAALADMVCSQSTTISKMEVSGSSLPCIFPAGIQHLMLDFTDSKEWPATEASDNNIEAMLYRLVHLKHLKSLYIDFSFDLCLPCPLVYLQALEVLTICLWIGPANGPCELDWLRRQRYSELHMQIFMQNPDEYDEALEEALISEIHRQQLPICSLSLDVDEDVQYNRRAWEALKVTHFSVKVSAGGEDV